MKKQIISLLLLTSLSQAENFYLGYDFLKVNYDDSGVNKEFDPTAVTWKAGYAVNEYLAVEARVGLGVSNDTKQNLITDTGLGLTRATIELNRVYSALLKGSYPLVKGLNVNAYVGASRVKFLVDSNQNYHSENSDNSLSVGAGLSYDIASDVFVNADYIAYTKNVTALQVGMGFRF
jgi:opacity protein-like surface antigen